MEELKRTLMVLEKSTGLGIALLDEEGNVSERFGDPCEFCRMICREDSMDERCKKAHRDAGQLSAGLGDSYIFACHTGLVSISLALINKNKLKGSILMGPLLLEYPDNSLMDDIIKQSGLPKGCKPLFQEVLRAIPLVDPERAYYLSQLLANLIYPALSEGDSELLEKRRKISLQQEMINEAIQSQNKAEELSILQKKREDELCERVAAWDTENAQRVMNDILGGIYFSSGGDLELIRVRIGQIIGILLSSLYKSGAADAGIFEPISEYQKLLTTSGDFEQISYGLGKLVAEFVDILKGSVPSGVSGIVRSCLSYIHRNYREDISLPAAASEIGVSPAHLSRVFKEEMEVGFAEYINIYRMEKAKELLRESGMTISEVAQTVGYANQQYFTKVFKRVTGETPGQYRSEIL